MLHMEAGRRSGPLLGSRQAKISLQTGATRIDYEKKTFFPEYEPWTLRNLTTKEYVRADKLAISKEFIHGPHIDVIGFGEVVILRTCWSTIPIGDRGKVSEMHRGKWAGHRLNITTTPRHKEEVGEAQKEWKDVSIEVRREIAYLWKREFGPDWRILAPMKRDIHRRRWDCGSGC